MRPQQVPEQVSMKAAVLHTFGEPLQIEDVSVPNRRRTRFRSGSRPAVSVIPDLHTFEAMSPASKRRPKRD